MRKNERHLIPADMSKVEAGRIFKDVFAKKLHVFDEPHMRYNKQTGVRERHKHFVFNMRMPFAHV